MSSKLGLPIHLREVSSMLRGMGYRCAASNVSEAAEELIRLQARNVGGDEGQNEAFKAGVAAGIEAAISGITATVYNVSGECSRRGSQDPETGEVPCAGEDENGCACSAALEIGDRAIKNLRSADIDKIAARTFSQATAICGTGSGANGASAETPSSAQ